MEYSDLKLKMNVKTAVYYEALTKKNFFQLENDEDVMKVIYSSLIINNPSIKITYKTFLRLIENEKFAKWVASEYKKIKEMNEQIGSEGSEESASASSDEQLTMTEISSALIVQHSVDPHYVMYEMEMWEVMPFFKAADQQKKAELAEQRLWTYLNISPHIDHKKIKKPEDIMPFPWEADDRKARAEKNLKNNEHAIKNLIGKQFDWIK